MNEFEHFVSARVGLRVFFRHKRVVRLHVCVRASE